jgi:hypothetical protein
LPAFAFRADGDGDDVDGRHPHLGGENVPFPVEPVGHLAPSEVRAHRVGKPCRHLDLVHVSLPLGHRRLDTHLIRVERLAGLGPGGVERSVPEFAGGPTRRSTRSTSSAG